MKLTLLGTGTPTPSLTRASAGFLLEIGGDKILIDHGPGAHNRYLESGRHAKDITHMFLTHFHYDHWLEYPRVVLTHWDQACGTRPELKAFGPEPLIELHDKLFNKDTGVYMQDLQARTERVSSQHFFEARGGTGKRQWPQTELTEMKPGDVVNGDNWTCTAAAVPHAGKNMKSLVYRFESDEGSVVFSGDTGYSTNFQKFCTDVDVLVHMCYYYSGTNFYGDNNPEVSGHLECARNGQAANAKTLVGIHQTEQLDVPGMREKCIQDIKEIYDGRFIWGEDLMEISIHKGDLTPIE